jgi:hypothetical protein
VKKLLSVSAGTLLLGVALLPFATARAEQPTEMNIRAPEFEDIDEWINAKPLEFKDLRGKVVVLHFWTFG